MNVPESPNMPDRLPYKVDFRFVGVLLAEAAAILFTKSFEARPSRRTDHIVHMVRNSGKPSENNVMRGQTEHPPVPFDTDVSATEQLHECGAVGDRREASDWKILSVVSDSIQDSDALSPRVPQPHSTLRCDDSRRR